MNIIIFGPQASGKGTQAKFLAEKLGLFYVSTGDLFRKLSKEDKEVKKLVKEGELPPDELAFRLLREYIVDRNKRFDNIIFDGFPRNVNQYHMLKQWLKEKNFKIDYAILLDISDKEALKRLSARRSCSKCGEIYNLITKPPKNPQYCDKCGEKLFQREDDKPDAITKRLFLYRNLTQPLIDLFEEENILRKINGEKSIKDISVELLNLLQR